MAGLRHRGGCLNQPLQLYTAGTTHQRDRLPLRLLILPLRETISRSYDTFGRPSGFALGDDYSVAYDYDMFGRFQSASSAQSAVSYTYSYLPNSDLLSGMTTAFGFRWIRAYESGRSRITSVENRFGETVISRYDYVHTVTECLGAS